jgi:hypothetical protein
MDGALGELSRREPCLRLRECATADGKERCQIAKRPFEMLIEQVGVLEIWCRARPQHGWPPRDDRPKQE